MPQLRSIIDTTQYDNSIIGYDTGFFRNCPQGQVWQILATQITMAEDLTTTGKRFVSIKLQQLADNSTAAILATIGDDLTSAGTGYSDLFSSGGFVDFFVPSGNTLIAAAQLAVTGTGSAWTTYNNPVLVFPGFGVQSSGSLLGSDYLSKVIITYLEWSEEEFYRKVTP